MFNNKGSRNYLNRFGSYKVVNPALHGNFGNGVTRILSGGLIVNYLLLKESLHRFIEQLPAEQVAAIYQELTNMSQ